MGRLERLLKEAEGSCLEHVWGFKEIDEGNRLFRKLKNRFRRVLRGLCGRSDGGRLLKGTSWEWLDFILVFFLFLLVVSRRYYVL